MKYMFAIYGDEAAQAEMQAELSPEEQAASMEPWFTYSEELEKAVNVLAGEGLHPTSSATTLRLQGEELVTSDGPFAETKEQLGGFYLIECDDLDTALEWAGKMPNLPFGGSVEVRPVQEFEQ